MYYKYLVRKYCLKPVILAGNLFAYSLYHILPKRLWEIDRPIFIIGCPRSGTTIFEELFRGHADLASWTEAGQIFQTNYYDPDQDHHLTRKDLTSFDKSRILVFFKFKMWIFRKSRFVNKNPRNSLRTDYLLALYPSAIFVHITRDGRAVVNSNHTAALKYKSRRTQPFGGFCKPPRWREHLDKPLLAQFAYQWQEIMSSIDEAKTSHLKSSPFFQLKYESLCMTPRKHIEELDHFCGLASKGRSLKVIPKQLPSQNEKWKTTLTSSQVDEISKIMSEGLRSHGYIQ